MNRRERIERKIDKREEWAEGRDAKAEELRNRTPDSIRHDWAFITQPGHIPERARMNRRDEKASEHRSMATHHRSKVGGLKRQLKSSIFSDDHDAIVALEDRIAKRERERDHMKKVNSLFRKKDAAGLLIFGYVLERLEEKVEKMYSWEKQPFPKWQISNLGATIRTDKKRIVEVKARMERSAAATDAGGVLIDRHEDINWCRVTFDEKPDREVLAALRAAGYRWGGGSWQGYLDKLPEEVK